MSTIVEFPKSSRSLLDPWYSFVQLGPHMVDRARSVADQADQYRGFKVGAVALAVNARGNLGIFAAANFKPYQYGPKECADKAVLIEVEKHRFDRVLVLVVSGPVQADTHSGIELPTLHPCGDCRGLLYSSSLIEDDTLIMPVHPDKDIYELYTRQELRAIHASVDDHDAPDAFVHYEDPGFEIWSDGPLRYSRLRSGFESAGVAVPGLGQLARLAVTGYPTI